MAITTFDKTNLKELRDDLSAALQEVARKHNIMIDLGGIRYSGTEAKVRLTARSFGGRVIDANPAAIANADLDSISKKHGLPESLFGRKVMFGKQTLTIIGAKLSRPKYPFIVEGVQGGKYKMTVDQIRDGLI